MQVHAEQQNAMVLSIKGIHHRHTGFALNECHRDNACQCKRGSACGFALNECHRDNACQCKRGSACGFALNECHCDNACQYKRGSACLLGSRALLWWTQTVANCDMYVCLVLNHNMMWG
jgi:hypothetical protein